MVSVAWRAQSARNFTRWHLAHHEGQTLCGQRIPETARVSVESEIIYDCEGCWTAYGRERAKLLEATQ